MKKIFVALSLWLAASVALAQNVPNGGGAMTPNAAPVTSTTPSGAAGGQLGCTYPNPCLNSGTLAIASTKTLTVSKTLTLDATADGFTLNIGAGGTLGTNAFTSTAYLPLAGGTMSGNIAMGGANISGGGTATFSSFVGALTGHASLDLPLTGGSLSGALTVSSGNLTVSTGHLVVEGVTSAGATGTGNLVFATMPTVSDLTVTGSFTATGLVSNADLANASVTVNGQTCTLGLTCTITGSATTIIPGTTTVTGGSAVSNGLLYNSAGVLTNLATANSGVLITSGAGVPSISTTLPSGITAPSLIVTTAFTATGLVTLADLATQATNTVLVNTTSGTASPTAQAVSSCSAAGDALIWTTNTGFGCNTSITAAAMPASGLTGTALASNVVSSSLTSVGTLTSVAVGAGSAITSSGPGGVLTASAYAAYTGPYLPLTGGTLTGGLLFTDNTLDIGAAGATRPRTGYFGTSIISPLVNGLTITNNGTNTLNIAAGKTLTDTSGIGASILLGATGGGFAAYGGASACSANNFVTALSAAGASTCGSSTISGVALGSNLLTLTFGTHLTAGGSSYNGSAAITITSDATNANTASTIVARDSGGNFSAGTITASLTGTASATPASGITGTTLASNVVTSSLTSAAGGSFGTGAFISTGTSGATIPLLNGANTWSGVQTFTNSNIVLLGSSTGGTTFSSANAGASNFTLTFPAATDTVVTLAATQTLTNKSIAATQLTGTLQAGQFPALTGDITTSAGSLATTLTTGNAGNLNSGTLLAARMPALTGDCTTSAGAVAMTCTSINGVNQTTAWTAYTPTVACTTSGSISADTVSGRYKILGKTVFLQFNVNIATLGSCLGNLTVSTPVTVNATGLFYMGSCLNITSALPVSVPCIANANSIYLEFAAAPSANNYYGSVTYEGI